MENGHQEKAYNNALAAHDADFDIFLNINHCAHYPSFINAEYGLAYLEVEGLSAVHSTLRQKAKLLLFVLDKKQNFCFLSNGRKQNFCFLSNSPNVLFTIAENNFSDPRFLRQTL
jgi:hypothetical protein